MWDVKGFGAHLGRNVMQFKARFARTRKRGAIVGYRKLKRWIDNDNKSIHPNLLSSVQ